MHSVLDDSTDEIPVLRPLKREGESSDSESLHQQTELPAVAQLTTDLPPPVRALRILCVDDNWDAADSLGELLAIAGHEVVVRHDANAALDTLARGFRPDVCVLDITMPGIDGCQLAAILRASRGEADLLLIAVTALNDYRSLERMAAAGFDLQFTKPVYPRDLYDAINNWAGLHATAASRV